MLAGSAPFAINPVCPWQEVSAWRKLVDSGCPIERLAGFRSRFLHERTGCLLAGLASVSQNWSIVSVPKNSLNRIPR